MPRTTLTGTEQTARLSFAVTVLVISLALFLIAGSGVGSFFNMSTIGIALGLFAWLSVVPKSLEYFMVSVPEVTGLVTVNWLNGEMRTHGTGVHFIYPWEQVKKGNFINLRIVTKQSSEDFPTSDGPLVKVKWSIQYCPTLDGLPRYIAVDGSTIDNGFEEVASASLSQEIGMCEALKLKSNKATQQKVLEKKLQDVFENHPVKDKSGATTTLEDLYGVDLLVVSIADLDYEASYQKARAATQINVQAREMAKSMVAAAKDEGSSMSFDEAYTNALVIMGSVTKNVQKLEGGDGALFLAMARAIGGNKK